MHSDTLKYFFDRTLSQNPAFIYRGVFEDNFTGLILEMAQIRNHRYPQENGINRKVSFMLVECFQNLLKHAENIGDAKEKWNEEGMFCFKNFSDGFVINSINIIREDEIEKLESIVKQVNSMSDKDLKNYYLDRLENNEISQKGGAGLGLIELARKSGQKILYKMEPLAQGFSLFHQQITLLLSNKTIDETFEQELEENHTVYTRMTQDGLKLIFKGDVSNKSLLPILDFLQSYVTKPSKLKQTFNKAAHVLIEVSQNITKNAEINSHGSNGLLMFGERNGRTVIQSGNIVGLSDKILLEEKLQYLGSLDQTELCELHKRTLQASLRFENKHNSGLGLIEIAKAGSEPISYKFYPVGREQFLFALAVTI